MCITILLLSIIGFGASLYGFMIEQTLKKNDAYKPLCDISDAVSCLKPLQSAYSKIFGVSNTVIGMLFYIMVGICALFNFFQFIFIVSLAAVMMSVWFAYILYFRIKTFCLLCNTVYVVNICLLLVSFICKGRV